MRFHKLGEIRFIGHGHGQREGPAQRGIGYLTEPYIHYNFSKGLAEWFAKHVDYARREAELLVEGEQKDDDTSGKLVRGRIAWRRRLIRLARHLPFRPLLRFCYVYFFHLGFLDGRAGWQFACMQMFYQFMIDSLARDLQCGIGLCRNHRH